MTKKYVSLNKLSVFFDNLKSIFATKTELDSNLATAESYTDTKTSKLVSYESQTLTDEQKVQARANIEACSTSDMPNTIIDVIELPIESVDDKAFYRLMTASCVENGDYLDAGCYCVDGLPETGVTIDMNMESVMLYYNIQNGSVYIYIESDYSSDLGLAVGWHLFESVAPTLDTVYEGVITNIADDPKDDAIRVLLEYSLYTYKEGLWTPLGDITSDVFSVDNSGNGWFAGDVFVGGTGLDDTSSKKLATNEYVDSQINSKIGNIDFSAYETIVNSDNKLATAKAYTDTKTSEAKAYTDSQISDSNTYTDNAVAQKSQVQIILWEADD